MIHLRDAHLREPHLREPHLREPHLREPHLRERRPSLSDLVDLRASLRRQELLLGAALRDVQQELRSWDRHRRAQETAGREVPRELSLIWQELAERERELVLDVLQVRASLAGANRVIARALRPSPGRAG